MNKPSILYLATSLNIGGTETNVFRLVEHFKNEYNVTVAVLKEPGHFGEILSKNGVKVVVLHGIINVISFLKDNRFDIVHSFLYRANIIARIAGRIAGTPAIISSRRALDKWRAPWQVILDRLTNKLADHVICNSQASRSVLVCEGYPDDKVSVIYNGVDDSAFNTNEPQRSARAALGLPLDEPIALITARLHAEKGFDLIPSIASNMPRGIFVIAGDGPLRKPVEAELLKLGISGRFHFLGWRQDIPRLMRASNIMLMPSREESFPQAALEAAACALPVVGFDIGGMKELIDDGQSGFLVSYLNCQALTKAANMLMSDTGRAKRMGLLAKEKSSHFTLKNMFEKTSEVYRSLI